MTKKVGGFKAMRTEKEGDQHFSNEQISGISLRFYHIEDKDERTNLFGCEVVLPKSVSEEINWEWAKEPEDQDPELAGTITMGQLMETVSVLCKQAQLHPNCMEITFFDGSKVDVSDIGMEDMLKSLLGKGEELAKAQFKDEKGKGMIPDGMTFDDWIEIAGPNDTDIDRILN
jgi:hypothetical protein